MKKNLFLTAAAFVALCVAFSSCGKKTATCENRIDSLTVAAATANFEGLNEHLLMRMGIDSANFDQVAKGIEASRTYTSDAEKAYAIGFQIGYSIQNGMLAELNKNLFLEDTTQTLNEDLFYQVFEGLLLGDSAVMDPQEAGMMVRQAMEDAYNQKLLKDFSANKEAGEAFLKMNKDKEGVITTESGLQYEVLRQGTGAKPTESDIVSVNYHGTLLNGEVFDSSVERGAPGEFRVNNVIKGWQEGLQLMPVGSKYRFYIPQELAYGSHQTGKIEPFSMLTFEVELLDIKK